MKGRRPIPAAIKIHEGNPGKRPIQVEPKPLQGLPMPLDTLDDVAKGIWDDVLRTMGCSGAITLAEAPLLELFATTYSNYKKAEAMVEVSGFALKVTAKDGTITWKPSPFCSEMHRFRDAALKMLVELGMTPVARARIGLEKQITDDFTAQYIS